jgi:serine/threonine protein kinase
MLSVLLYYQVAVSTVDPTQIFKVLCKIGQGSYGAVYKGIDLRTNKEVGLKLLSIIITFAIMP